MPQNIYNKKFIKKILPSQYKKNCFVYSINMANTKQNNKIEYINKEINLLQDRLKKNEKSLNQFQNGLMQIGRIWVKKGKSTNLSQTKKLQNVVKNIFKNNIKQIKKKTLIYCKIYLHN